MAKIFYNLSLELKDNLQKIESLRKEILLTPINPKTELKLGWEAMVQRIYWSLSIAGNPMTKAQVVKVLIANKTPIDASSKQVVNYRRALEYIRENWVNQKKNISVSASSDLIDIVGDGSRGKEREIREVLEYVQAGKDHPIIQAGIIQIEIGNVLGGLIAFLILSKHGYDFRRLVVVEEILAKDSKSWREIAGEAELRGNLTHFLEYYSKKWIEALEKAYKNIEEIRLQLDIPSDFWDLNERQRGIINRLDEPNISINNRMVQKMYKVSQITASRDLAKLVSLGLVFPHGKGRSVYYTKV